MYDVLVAGELNVDMIVVSEDVAPEFGAEKLVDDFQMALGSSSAIFACGIHKLGASVGFVSIVGDDALGRYLVDSLRDKGMDTSLIKVDPSIKTGVTLSLSSPGDRAFLTYLGSINRLTYDMIDPSLFEAARHFHISSFYLQSGLRESHPALFRRAKELGLTTSLDTGYDPDEEWDGKVWEVLRYVDVFMPNEVEALSITGEVDVEMALNKLAERVGLVAIKLGREGAICKEGGRILRASPPAVDVVDTTGAGDSFDAGFVYGYIMGYSVEDCLKLGNACGALSTRAVGGTTAQATLEEAKRFGGIL
ncbi:MAG: carbohydrate kinase family protein [bacterium]